MNGKKELRSLWAQVEKIVTSVTAAFRVDDRSGAGLVELKSLIDRGDDERAVVLSDGFPPTVLRTSEQLWLARAKQRLSAVADVQAAVWAGDEEMIRRAYNVALRYGCTLPESLATVAREKTTKISESCRSVESAHVDAVPHTVVSTRRVETKTETSIEIRRAQQKAALNALRAEIGRRDEVSIVQAIGLVRDHGAEDEELPWDELLDLEERVSTRVKLRAALASGDGEKIGRAWARIRFMANHGLTEEEVARANEAFLSWGAALRKSDEDVNNES